MLFNSFIYLFIFLPIVLAGFYILASTGWRREVNLWLIGASLVFYGYWKMEYVLIILASILVNYSVSRLMIWSSGRRRRKIFLILGICFNVALLGYFKYIDFLIINVSLLLDIKNPGLLDVALPLGISFFTFQQIAFLVDRYHNRMSASNVIDYSLFVCFFPQLIAGPIVHHGEMMPQFASEKNKTVDWDNVYKGLFFIAIGLFKKMAVADTFAVPANVGFGDPSGLGFLTAWVTSLSYTFQLYFDFSAYTDMALGSARLFNIRLPLNFNSPYKALDIQDFWRRWHMTLSRFLRDYIYIPLGGNRKGRFRICFNLFVTFLIGGIWHGAGWTFFFWGALHGVAMIVHRFWRHLGLRAPGWLAWLLTFFFVNAAWVYFRAPTLGDAHSILSKMAGLDAARSVAEDWSHLISGGLGEIPGLFWLGILVTFMLLDIMYRNSQEWVAALKPRIHFSAACVVLFSTGVYLLMDQSRFSEFLYFQF